MNGFAFNAPKYSVTSVYSTAIIPIHTEPETNIATINDILDIAVSMIANIPFSPFLRFIISVLFVVIYLLFLFEEFLFQFDLCYNITFCECLMGK